MTSDLGPVFVEMQPLKVEVMVDGLPCWFMPAIIRLLWSSFSVLRLFDKVFQQFQTSKIWTGSISAKVIHPHEGPQERWMWLFFKLGLFHCIKHWRGCLHFSLKKFYFKFLYSNTQTEPRKGGVAFLSRKSINSGKNPKGSPVVRWPLYPLKKSNSLSLHIEYVRACPSALLSKHLHRRNRKE